MRGTPLYLTLVLAALVVIGLLAILWWRRAARLRNEAGISTSVAGRTSQLGGMMTRRFFRRLWLRLRQALATREHKKELARQFHLESASEAAQVLGNMKGVFMKLGQIVSFANDALPPEARAALQTLQKDAPPMAFHLVRGVIERELGGDLADHFKHIDEEPIAAASIGQVHRGTLRDGTEVAIKVQYPGVDEAIEADLKASDKMALLIDMVNKSADLTAVIAELKERMLDELDYRKEARNQQLFGRLWEGHPLIRIPRVHLALSQKRVLTQQYVRGFGFYDFLKQANAQEKRVASFAIGDFVFDSMFRNLVYNGDPHPGNYLFAEDGGVWFLDFGCVKYFRPDFMVGLKRFFRAIIENDRARHDAFVREIGLVIAKSYEEEFMWEMWRYHLEPYTRDEEFVFDEDYLERARKVMDPARLRTFNLPPDLLFFLRITFGLNAISRELGSAGNFHRVARRYFYDEGAAPALAQLGVSLPPRFLASDVEPVAPPEKEVA
jgi:predicted unusual protein kinase regulating ubiquinone biosynthesis (AarF/ABC1/UbiB family)